MTHAEADWLANTHHLAAFLRWLHEHDGETMIVDGDEIEIGCPCGQHGEEGPVAGIVYFLEKPWKYVGELRAFQMNRPEAT